MEVKEKELENVHQGNNVKWYRDIFSFSQEKLAEKIGISQQTLSLYESKEVLPSDVLTQIAKGFNIPVRLITHTKLKPSDVKIDNSTFNGETVIGPNHCTFNFNPLETVCDKFIEVIKLLKVNS